jgi:hypothetical protein
MLAVLAMTLATALAQFEEPTVHVHAEATRVLAQFTPAERYRFNLGGESGQYTDWEREDLAHFDGLSTTIHFTAVKGRPSDKWASIARINLFGAGERETRKQVSIILTVDRKTKQVSPALWRGKDRPRPEFEVALSSDEAVDMKILTDTPGQLTISFGESIFRVDSDFDIKAIGVLGSGLDARFDPFVLLRRTDPR